MEKKSWDGNKRIVISIHMKGPQKCTFYRICMKGGITHSSCNFVKKPLCQTFFLIIISSETLDNLATKIDKKNMAFAVDITTTCKSPRIKSQKFNSDRYSITFSYFKILFYLNSSA